MKKLTGRKFYIKNLQLPKKLAKKAWLLQSVYLKKKNSNFQDLAECFTCKKLYPAKELHQGHRYHGKLDLDLRNIHLQCLRCNHFLSGNLGNYERNLILELGLDGALQLERDAAQFTKYSVEKLEKIIKEYEDLIKELKEATN